MVARSTKYYRDNPDARKRKYKSDKKWKKSKSYKKKKVEAQRKRRAADKKGVSRKGKDYDHRTGRFISSSKNRGAKGEGARKSGSKRTASTRKKLGRRYKKK